MAQPQTDMPVSKALFVGIEAEPGREAEVADFLRNALTAVEAEPDTRHWYSLRFNAREFAIFDTFPGNAGRLKHLLGQVGRALVVKSFTMLEGLPDIDPAEIIALKPPASSARPRLALHVPLRAKAGQEDEVAAFLRGAKPLVEAEPGTAAWYALRFGSSSFAIFDTFADEGARQAHLSGKVAAALTERAGSLFETAPEIRKADVLACKLPT